MSDQYQQDPRSPSSEPPVPYAAPVPPDAAPAGWPPQQVPAGWPPQQVPAGWPPQRFAGPPPTVPFGTRLRRLPLVAKAGLAVGAALVLCCGGVAVGGLADGPKDAARTSPAAGPAGLAEPVASDPASTAADPAGSAPPTAGELPASAAPRTPTVQKRTVTETARIPFSTRTVQDPSLAAGTRKIRVPGVTGVRTLVYEVTLTDGKQTARRLLRQSVTKTPVTQVTAVGTKQQRQCDPNYSGACVPIASDVDCAGGSGNGPAYVQGPVRVVGDDIYDLDSDGDGIGCED